MHHELEANLTLFFIIGLLWMVKGENMEYGYARVSSVRQDLDRQLLELKKYVPEKNIVIDKESGQVKQEQE